MLSVDAYRAAVLEGMVACIGGLDGHLSKQATAALLEQSRCDGTHTAGEMTTLSSRKVTLHGCYCSACVDSGWPRR